MRCIALLALLALAQFAAADGLYPNSHDTEKNARITAEGLLISPSNESFVIDWNVKMRNDCDCSQRFSFMFSQGDAQSTTARVSGRPLDYTRDNGNIYFSVDFAPSEEKYVEISYENTPANMQFNLNGWEEAVAMAGVQVMPVPRRYPIELRFSEQPHQQLNGGIVSWDFENVPKGKTFGIALQGRADFAGVAALAALFIVALLLLAAEKRRARAARISKQENRAATRDYGHDRKLPLIRHKRRR